MSKRWWVTCDAIWQNKAVLRHNETIFRFRPASFSTDDAKYIKDALGNSWQRMLQPAVALSNKIMREILVFNVPHHDALPYFYLLLLCTRSKSLQILILTFNGRKRSQDDKWSDWHLFSSINQEPAAKSTITLTASFRFVRKTPQPHFHHHARWWIYGEGGEGS